MLGYTAHVDTFARDNLPPEDQWPTFLLDDPEFQYPEKINCAAELVDVHVAQGHGDRVALRSPNESWTYSDLLARANRIANVLVDDLGLVPGNRVLLRSANNPMVVACWLGVVKAGGIAVTTMPLLRAKELKVIAEKGQVHLALCDERLAEEMEIAVGESPVLEKVVYFNGSGETGAGAQLEERMAAKPETFDNVETGRDDVVLIGFTSGTTGAPKGTMHFHRDLLIICDACPKSVLNVTPDDVFIGSPPLAFTFGLGGLATFPLRHGASSYLIEAAPPPVLLPAIAEAGATLCFTAPSAYRAMTAQIRSAPQGTFDLSSLRAAVSAGEGLPLATYTAWVEATGVEMVDGLGATELLHIFIATPPGAVRPGATGKPIHGYEACVMGPDMKPLPPGEVGRLAVRGPTGCRYLADDRQREYVADGWNLTGDAYRVDEDGYFWFEARADDMIISSGYNIAGPEVEDALLSHGAVAECAVVGVPDEERGQIVKAFVVPSPDAIADDALAKDLQDYVKQRIAPYKYPRAVAFVGELPKTESGKIQRFRLREGNS